MNKFYVGLAALAMGGVTFAQNATQLELRTVNIGDVATESKNIPLNTAIGNEKVGGVVAWSDDFSTGGVWTINNQGEPSPFGWEIHTGNASSWFYTAGINSTSGGEYAELYNGDPTTGSPAPVNQTFTMETTASIDVMAAVGTDQVSLQFEQYGARFQDLQEVYVSTDGSTWIKVGDNDDIPNLTINGGSSYPDPMLRTYNIASAISGGASTVWIRFQWMPDVQNITYGWFIDDVAIVTNDDNNLTMDNSMFGVGAFQFPYYITPIDQIAEISFSANVSNNGAVAQPNTRLEVTANSTVFSSASASLAVLASDSLVTTTGFTPPASIASYTADFNVVSDSTESSPSDNTASYDFEVSQDIYARDQAGMSGANTDGSIVNWSGASGQAFKIGNIFEMIAADEFGAIDVVLSSGTYHTNSPVVFAEVYRYDTVAATYNFLETTEELTISSTAQMGTVLTLPLYSKVAVVPGDDILVVACHYGGDASGSDDIAIASSGDAPDNSVIGYDASNSLVGLAGPVNVCVRFNHYPEWGIEEPTIGMTLGQNMPNPFTSTSTIRYELDNASELTFEIVDMTGKTVKVMDLGNRAAGEHTITIDGSELATGVYYYSLISGEYRVTNKMVIQK